MEIGNGSPIAHRPSPICPRTADISHASRAPETDGDAAVDDDDGHLAAAMGEAEHALELRRLFLDVEVLDAKTLSGVVLTGRLGVGSGVLAEDEHGSGHASKVPEIAKEFKFLMVL